MTAPRAPRRRRRSTCYASQLADFLADANPHLDATALTSLLQQHAGHLTSQVEAYAAADYERTYAEVRAGYSHMFMTGEALALAIATQFPDLFPTDAAAPDTATMPDESGRADERAFCSDPRGRALLSGLRCVDAHRAQRELVTCGADHGHLCPPSEEGQ